MSVKRGVTVVVKVSMYPSAAVCHVTYEIINVVNSHKVCELCWGPNFFHASGRGWLDPGVIGPYKTMHVQLRFMLINSARSCRLVTKNSTIFG